MPITILITRPEPGGSRFAEQLRDAQVDLQICLSPVLRILPEAGDIPLDGVRGLIFTSQYGVAEYAARTSVRDLPGFAVGGATAEAAQAVGLAVSDGGGDAEALVAHIIAQRPRGPLLHLRGSVAAGDVVGDLSAAGIETRAAVLYRQEAAAPAPEAQSLLAGSAPVIVPFFSPRSAALWFAQGAAQAHPPLVILALSAAVARAVPEGAGTVLVAARPDAQAMLDLMPDAIAAAKRLEGANGAQ